MHGYMRWIERFEAKYVDIFRIMVVLVVIFALLGLTLAVGNWSQTKVISKSYLPEEQFTPPNWLDVRDSVLPAVETENPIEIPDSQQIPEEEAPLIDPNVSEIYTILSKQFERNNDGVQQFRALLPRRYLQEVILEDRMVPEDWRSGYMEGVKALAVELSVDERINRISSIEFRAETLLLAIQRYILLYGTRIDEARAEAAALNLQEVARQAAADGILFTVLPVSVGALLSIIMLIIFIRIEVHLRKLAEKA